MIPDEAVDAAWHAMPKDSYVEHPDHVYAMLVAALPYLSEAAEQPQRISLTDWPDVPRRQ